MSKCFWETLFPARNKRLRPGLPVQAAGVAGLGRGRLRCSAAPSGGRSPSRSPSAEGSPQLVPWAGWEHLSEEKVHSDKCMSGASGGRSENDIFLFWKSLYRWPVMKMPEKKKSGPFIILLWCGIMSQREKSMRINNWKKGPPPLGRSLLVSNIPFFYKGRLDKLEIKENGTDVFSLIRIMLWENARVRTSAESRLRIFLRGAHTRLEGTELLGRIF